jgi:AraC-like DNA-binding protein
MDSIKPGQLIEVCVKVHLVKNYMEFRHFHTICNFNIDSNEFEDSRPNYVIYFYIEEAELLKYFDASVISRIPERTYNIPIYDFEYPGNNDLSDLDSWIMCFEHILNMPASVFRSRFLFILEKWYSFNGLKRVSGVDVYLSPYEESIFCGMELYIRSTNLADLRMCDILKHTGCSYYSLNKIVKKKTSTTLYNHILKLKVELAKHLLLNEPDKRVKDIAYQLGFSNVSKFIQGFKKNHSMTPMRYRNVSTMVEPKSILQLV